MVSKEVFVTKRDGSLVPYNVEKIKQTVEWACEGLEVQHLSLESKFDEFVFNRISTKQIQDNLIHHAKSLASPVESDWVFVAGRLETMNRWAATRSYDIPFLEFFKKQKSLGIWCHPMFDKYSDQDITELGKEIIKDNDLKHSYASVTTALSKYLLPNECIQHMFMGNAMVIAGVEKPEVRLEFAKKVYKALSDRKISLATPWLSNLRNNGNISSCFIIAVDDNIHSIFDNLKKAALISKNGGGLGVSLAKVRCRGSKLMGNEGGSGGVLGWCKLFNDTAVSVNQGGKRAGAFTVELPIWHGDIDEFLDIQTESGDQRKKAYDIKPQVTINDIFMRLKDDGESSWLTFCPYEVKEKLDIELFNCFGGEFEKAYELCVKAADSGVLKVVRRYKAKELFKQIMKVQFETGLPYIAFIDEINRQNPNKHIGNIPCVNLCTESFSVVISDDLDHTCNLASLVMGRIEVDEIPEYAALATRILDNGISLTSAPTEGSQKHNNLLRTVGVGIQGYADLIAREHKSFLDIEFATKIAEMIEWGCVNESITLAKDRGKYPAYDGSDWDNGVRIDSFAKNSVTSYDWKGVQDKLNQFGIRNSQMTSPAPNTSTSGFMDAAASMMPVYSAFFYEDNRDGLLPVAAMYIKENPLSYARDITRFKPWDVTQVVGAMQKFIDTGISAEYIMDKNQDGFNAKWLWDTIDSAWKNKNKAVYYIRTIKKGEKLVQSESDCAGCAA